MEKAKIIRAQTLQKQQHSGQAHLHTHMLGLTHSLQAHIVNQPMCAYRPTFTCTHVPSPLHTHQNLGGSNTSLSKTISFANPCTCQLLSQWPGARSITLLISVSLDHLDGRQGYKVAPAGLPGQPGSAPYS